MESQREQILRYLKEGNVIDPMVALQKFQSYRLGARIYELRAEGHDIKSEVVFRGKRKIYARYWM
ncbi:MAG TPA: helix-turn-helix domain-containing protein [Deltaproteobacteria bacterium]|nr:helix-turn-helix domain-containing protein [Deltaproteobacteria bacterium]